jgi:hypothetical protein
LTLAKAQLRFDGDTEFQQSIPYFQTPGLAKLTAYVEGVECNPHKPDEAIVIGKDPP